MKRAPCKLDYIVAIFLSVVIMYPAAAKPGGFSPTTAMDMDSSAADPADSLSALFWNLENFFDWKDSGAGESDHDFSPEGSRHWTSGRFYRKCNAIAKSIYWMSERHGGMPAIVGLAEVENRDVLTRLIYGTALRKAGYGIVHYDSPDHRGIDVALLYRKEIFRLLSSKSCHVDTLQTRDILFANLVGKDSGDTMSVIVVHLPSKYGGEESEWKRAVAAKRLYEIADSLYQAGNHKIMICGDFNDVPNAKTFNCLKPLLVNLSESLAAEGKGTIRYDGRWNLIDMFWVSPMLVPYVSIEIVRIPFLMTWDNVMAGEKPHRTYSGPRYLGGVSDHCPIVLKLFQ